jgi:hypothetical protein
MQTVDQRKALNEFRERFTEPRPVVTIRGDMEWERKMSQASCIAVYPTPLGDDRWQDIAEFALMRGKVTNAGYVSRWRPETIRDLDSRIVETSGLTAQYSDCAVVIYVRNSEERQAVVRTVVAKRKDVFVAVRSAPNVILIETE